MKEIDFGTAIGMMGKPLEETDRLRRCPLCDDSAEMRLVKIADGKQLELTYGVVCNGCGLRLEGKLREYLVRRWNERPIVSVTQL